MKKLVYIMIILLSGLNINAQNPFINPSIFYMPAPGPEKYYADKNDNGDADDHSWARYQINSGIIFNSLNGYNSINTYISPSVLLPVNSKFAISIEGTYINNYTPGFGEGDLSGTSDFIMNVSGIYSVNEKTTVYGNYSRSLLKPGLFGEDGFESMTLGLEFRPSPSVRIGASVTTSSGLNPYYMRTGYMPYRYRPYY